jgi:type I restriction enzyme S subunit
MVAKERFREGYKLTEVGVIPEDWKVKTLGQLGSFSKGRGIKKDESKSGNIPCIRYGELYTIHNDYIKSYNSFISEDIAETSKRLKKGDILFAGSGETKEEIGKCATFIDNFKAYVGGDVVVLSPKNGDSIYLGYLLNAPFVNKQKASKGQGDAIVHISSSSLSDIVIPIPALLEQTAIARALTDTDKLIGSLERLIEKKRKIKQGAMQDLLTGRKRLPGFSGQWEEVSVGEIGKTYGGLTGKTKDDFESGDSLYITFLNVMNNTVINMNDFESVHINGTEKQNLVQKGDLFFNTSSETPEEVGMCSVLLKNVVGVFLNSFCFGFRIHNESLFDALYLSYYFRSVEGRNLFYSLAQGATRYNLSKNAFRNLGIQYPLIREQKAIAKLLSDMDTEIEALEQRLEKCKSIKQGMMQELLTGRIRLI